MARRDELLMRYHDGELAESRRARIEEQLAASDQARAELRGMEHLGRLLRERTQQTADAQRFEALTSNVLRRLGDERPLSLLERLRFRLRERFRPWAVWPVAAAKAVAVVLLLALSLGQKAHPSNDCTIESIEYAGTAAAIFLIPDDRGQGSTTVIWTREAEEPDAGEPE